MQNLTSSLLLFKTLLVENPNAIMRNKNQKAYPPSKQNRENVKQSGITSHLSCLRRSMEMVTQTIKCQSLNTRLKRAKTEIYRSDNFHNNLIKDDTLNEA